MVRATRHHGRSGLRPQPGSPAGASGPHQRLLPALAPGASGAGSRADARQAAAGDEVSVITATPNGDPRGRNCSTASRCSATRPGCRSNCRCIPEPGHRRTVVARHRARGRTSIWASCRPSRGAGSGRRSRWAFRPGHRPQRLGNSGPIRVRGGEHPGSLDPPGSPARRREPDGRGPMAAVLPDDVMVLVTPNGVDLGMGTPTNVWRTTRRRSVCHRHAAAPRKRAVPCSGCSPLPANSAPRTDRRITLPSPATDPRSLPAPDLPGRPPTVRRCDAVGPIDPTGPASSLSRQRCLRATVDRARKFCLAALEARATGLPVLARPRPALTEVHRGRRTGCSPMTTTCWRGTWPGSPLTTACGTDHTAQHGRSAGAGVAEVLRLVAEAYDVAIAARCPDRVDR